MSKPIFIIRVPLSAIFDSHEKNEVAEMIESFKSSLVDYHCFAILESESDRIQFECYNATDNATIEDLKRKISQKIEINLNK